MRDMRFCSIDNKQVHPSKSFLSFFIRWIFYIPLATIILIVLAFLANPLWGIVAFFAAWIPGFIIGTLVAYIRTPKRCPICHGREWIENPIIAAKALS